MSEMKTTEDRLGRDPNGSGCRPTDETPTGSHASGASIPRAAFDVSDRDLMAVIEPDLQIWLDWCGRNDEAPEAKSGAQIATQAVRALLLQRHAPAIEAGTAETRQGLGPKAESAIGKAEAPVNSLLLSALKAMDAALTVGYRHPDDPQFDPETAKAEGMWPEFYEAWKQIRSAISQADGL